MTKFLELFFFFLNMSTLKSIVQTEIRFIYQTFCCQKSWHMSNEWFHEKRPGGNALGWGFSNDGMRIMGFLWCFLKKKVV